jgi:hypothetical protein
LLIYHYRLILDIRLLPEENDGHHASGLFNDLDSMLHFITAPLTNEFSSLEWADIIQDYDNHTSEPFVGVRTFVL